MVCNISIRALFMKYWAFACPLANLLSLWTGVLIDESEPNTPKKNHDFTYVTTDYSGQI